MTQDPEDPRMPLTTSDPLDERIEKLKELIPEAFAEGEIDFERLRQALGDSVGEGRERYGLSWAGKADAIRAIQAPSAGTLVPCPEESVNFDTTENLFIEGDNLEVLKLLQKSYYGKVKMIYIDPPYNTGGEFIYPDNFREGLEDYLKYSGQAGEGGVKLSTNTETSGRYHSKWLNMMYPRLFLARNLLRDDGAIFVSIDDHEAHNLRLMMDEVFGAENFVAAIVWQKKQSPQNDATYFSDMHDYILVYARQARLSKTDPNGWYRNLFPRGDEQNARYKNPDDDPRGEWTSADLTCNKTADERPNLYFAVQNPSTGEDVWPKRQRVWGYEPAKMQQLLAENRISWGGDGNSFPRLKRFLSEVAQGIVPSTWWDRTEFGDNQEAAREVQAIFAETYGVFSTPKPTRLIKGMLTVATCFDEDAIVLDFFAGSGSTGHAVFGMNSKDGGNRRFILVQLPEHLSEPKQLEGGKELRSISDIGIERLRRVSQELESEVAGKFDAISEKPVDFGFRVLKLASSNFKVWDATGSQGSSEAVANQLKLFADHVLPNRSEQDILYELMLKSGLPLTAPVDETTVAHLTVYSIAGGLMMICLADEITQDVLRGMIQLAPQRIVCLDAAFKGNDQLKTNTVLEMKSHNIEFRTV